MIALIGARGGSKRIRSKNIKPLGGLPLILWTLRHARNAGCFDPILVSTDSSEIAECVEADGFSCIMRPSEYATDYAPDIDWLRWTLTTIPFIGDFDTETFAILRATSPFRDHEYIQDAKYVFDKTPDIDSLRAMKTCTERPEKQWIVTDGRAYTRDRTPLASQQYAELERINGPVYMQTGALEMAYSKPVLESGILSGYKVAPYIREGALENLDINTIEDWWMAEMLVSRGEVSVPK